MAKNKDYEESSGNVFKDLGLSNADEEFLKANLAITIHRIIKKRGLTQQQAAELLGVDQPEVSKLKKGLYSRFKVERLFQFLNKLGRRIEIKVRKPKKDEPLQAFQAVGI